MVRIISWVMKYLFTLVQFIILACEYLLTQDTSYMCHGHRNPPHLNGSCYRLWRPLRGLHAAGHLKTPAITAAHSTGHMPSTEPEDITCQVFKQVWSPCTLCKQRKNQIHKTWIGALPLPTGTAVFTISVIKGRWHQEREAAITIQACSPPPRPPPVSPAPPSFPLLQLLRLLSDLNLISLYPNGEVAPSNSGWVGNLWTRSMVRFLIIKARPDRQC